MLPTLVSEIPSGDDWLYEVKYDGFRALIYLTETETKLVSRNQHLLNQQFPEIVDFFQSLSKQIKIAPCIIDGELCVLKTDIKASFELIQKRGRLKNINKIKNARISSPVTFMAFDILMTKGDWQTKKTLFERKKILEELFACAKTDEKFFLLVATYSNGENLWTEIKKGHGEGIVAKHKDSFWQEGKRSKQWLKIKNLLAATFFVLGYDQANSFFHIGCLDNKEIKLIGKVGQGFSKEEREALIAIVKKNQTKILQGIIYIDPSICIEVEFLELSKNELRHPKFRRFRFDKQWEECSWEAIQKQELN